MSIDRESVAFKAACAAFRKPEWATDEPRLMAAIEAYEAAKASEQTLRVTAGGYSFPTHLQERHVNQQLEEPRTGNATIRSKLEKLRVPERESIYQTALELAYILIEKDYQEEDPTTGRRYIAKVAEPAWAAICEALYGNHH